VGHISDIAHDGSGEAGPARNIPVTIGSAALTATVGSFVVSHLGIEAPDIVHELGGELMAGRRTIVHRDAEPPARDLALRVRPHANAEAVAEPAGPQGFGRTGRIMRR
jgi:hypothetical protein